MQKLPVTGSRSILQNSNSHTKVKLAQNPGVSFPHLNSNTNDNNLSETTVGMDQNLGITINTPIKFVISNFGIFNTNLV